MYHGKDSIFNGFSLNEIIPNVISIPEYKKSVNYSTSRTSDLQINAICNPDPRSRREYPMILSYSLQVYSIQNISGCGSILSCLACVSCLLFCIAKPSVHASEFIQQFGFFGEG